MTRCYRAGVQVELAGSDPVGFSWARRRYRVRSVLAHWVEATAWWQGSNAGSKGQACEVWRVEAVSRTGSCGVYDLACVVDDWRLLRVID